MPEQATASSLLKALRILMALDNHPAGRGITELARELRLPKSAVHRILTTFQSCGFVQQHLDSRYTMGLTLARLGLRAADQLTPRLVARPHLEALVQDVGETALLGVLHETQVLIAEKIEAHQDVRVAPEVGTVVPVQRTALGHVLLAWSPAEQQETVFAACLPPASALAAEHGRWRQQLTTVAQQGFAITTESWLPELCCIAVPLRKEQGRVVAALAVAVPRSRMPPLTRHDPFGGGAPHPSPLVAALLRTAERLAAALP